IGPCGTIQTLLKNLTRGLGRALSRGDMRIARLAALILLLAVTGSVPAQVTTATFYGIVTDPTGAVVPGASVTLTHEGTSATATRITDAAGEFIFDFLRVGSYTLRIEARGFKKLENKGIDLASGQTVREKFALEVGSLAETVTVEGSA